jgi:hypothetical protein
MINPDHGEEEPQVSYPNPYFNLPVFRSFFPDWI